MRSIFCRRSLVTKIMAVCIAISALGTPIMTHAESSASVHSILSRVIDDNCGLYTAALSDPTIALEYFDSTGYLATYSDVGQLFGEDHKAALDHYMTYGIYEGRSSCSTFDPAVAVIAFPELKAKNNYKLDSLFKAYTKLTGSDSTEGMDLIVDSATGEYHIEYDSYKICVSNPELYEYLLEKGLVTEITDKIVSYK